MRQSGHGRNQPNYAPIAQDYYHWRFGSMTGVAETVMERADYIFQYGMASLVYLSRPKCLRISTSK